MCIIHVSEAVSNNIKHSVLQKYWNSLMSCMTRQGNKKPLACHAQIFLLQKNGGLGQIVLCFKSFDMSRC